MSHASCMLVIHANREVSSLWKIWDPTFAFFVDFFDQTLIVTIVLAVVVEIGKGSVFDAFGVGLPKFDVTMLLEKHDWNDSGVHSDASKLNRINVLINNYLLIGSSTVSPSGL